MDCAFPIMSLRSDEPAPAGLTHSDLQRLVEAEVVDHSLCLERLPAGWRRRNVATLGKEGPDNPAGDRRQKVRSASFRALRSEVEKWLAAHVFLDDG
jgi:hypothetical protein